MFLLLIESDGYFALLGVDWGRRIRYAVKDENQAKKLVRETLRRRSTARKRMGVPYRFCQLIDPHQWFPVALE